MNFKQQRAVEIRTGLEAGSLDPKGAAELLGASTPQVRRLRERFSQDGLPTVVHGNTGRPPANCTDPATANRILALAGLGGPYQDVNVCHLHERLSQDEQVYARFARDPEDPNVAWVALPAGLDTSYYFAVRETRKVRQDRCISFSGQTLQLLVGQGSLPDE